MNATGGALGGLRVLEAADGIAGGYAGKLLADQGAVVVKVERPGGDALRTWSAATPDEPGRGALFAYLAAGKASVLDADPGWADVVLAGPDVVELLGAGWRTACRPDAVVVSVTPFGLDGPLAGQPADELTLQGWCGLLSACGTKDMPPTQIGNGTGAWATGATAALAALAGRRAGGADIDVAALEVMAVCLTNYPSLYRQFTGQVAAMSRGGDWPSVVRCKDGWIGLCIFTAQQWSDFAVMLGRPDLSDDERLSSMGGRSRNRAFAESVIRPWLEDHTAAEIHELGGLFRIPVAFVGNGESVFEMEQVLERGVLVPNAGGFQQPRPPFLQSASPVLPIRPAPELGTGRHDGGTRAPIPGTSSRPLAGITVLDLTAFWAGPYATHLLATLGADVLKIESPKRPDGMRFATVAKPTDDDWLEYGPTFHGANPGKRSVAIDFSTPSGRELLLDLVAHADVVVENFTPRVLPNAGLDHAELVARRSDVILLRMPGFGLDGPWRDHPGFAQTMEQVSGIGWLTGLAEGEPIVRSTIDPIAGIHGAFAVLAALEHRARTGEGQLIELPMMEVALNIAAESIITWSAEGVRLDRQGNRGPRAAPQGVYPCAGDEQWVALAVATDAQWDALVTVLDRPAWALAPELADRAGRRAAHDDVDAHLARWLADRDRDRTVEQLLAAGIPAAPVWDQNAQDQLPQLVARGFTQTVEHPVAGPVATPGIGMRSSQLDIAYRAPAPTVGQHTGAVLREVLGLGGDDLARLVSEGAIGTV
ncbi:MAG: caib/baif family protein [Acidimicrobiales bacterium]|nr:caib/baif family protein [Acidimicrobiales bacterium]